ncbi:MAG TPA: nuclear transport factor 2 family protein [Longimicrobium sp.]|jgi:ketosteroid isomerase-like protein
MRDRTRPRRLAPAALALVHAACDPPPPVPRSDARAEVEAQYERLAEAIRRNDLEAILALQAPDFTSRNPNGQAFDYAAMEDYTRRMTSAIDSVIHIRNRIREFTLRGDTAVADVCQELSRIQRIGDSPRRVDTSALQTETWVRRPEGWRRRHVENVRGLRWFVEGVRVEPGRPYAPGAPEYRPDPDPPTGCGLR